MSRKKTVFIVLLAALVVFTAVVSMQSEDGDSSRVQLAAFEKDELESINFINTDESWTLENKGEWKVKGSEKTMQNSVDTLLAAILCFDGKYIADAEADKEAYGISENSIRIEFNAKNGSQKVFVLGNKTPPGTEYYLMDAEANVYSVYSAIGNAFKNRKYQMLDSFIYGIEYSEISRIEVDGIQPFSLINKQDKWVFESGNYTENISLEDIRSKVTRHFGGMYSLSMLDATPENGESCGFGENSSVCTVTITNRQGDKDKIYIGNETEKGTYIKVNDINQIYLVISDYFNFIKLFREVVL